MLLTKTIKGNIYIYCRIYYNKRSRWFYVCPGAKIPGRVLADLAQRICNDYRKNKTGRDIVRKGRVYRNLSSVYIDLIIEAKDKGFV